MEYFALNAKIINLINYKNKIILLPLIPMPHGSNKSPEKNHNEIRNLLCMLHGSDKLWRIMKKMTDKNLNKVKKTSSSD